MDYANHNHITPSPLSLFHFPSSIPMNFSSLFSSSPSPLTTLSPCGNFVASVESTRVTVHKIYHDTFNPIIIYNSPDAISILLFSPSSSHLLLFVPKKCSFHIIDIPSISSPLPSAPKLIKNPFSLLNDSLHSIRSVGWSPIGDTIYIICDSPPCILIWKILNNPNKTLYVLKNIKSDITLSSPTFPLSLSLSHRYHHFTPSGEYFITCDRREYRDYLSVYNTKNYTSEISFPIENIEDIEDFSISPNGIHIVIWESMSNIGGGMAIYAMDGRKVAEWRGDENHNNTNDSLNATNTSISSPSDLSSTLSSSTVFPSSPSISPLSYGIKTVHWSSDGRYLFFSLLSEDNKIFIFDVINNQVVGTLKMDGRVSERGWGGMSNGKLSVVYEEREEGPGMGMGMEGGDLSDVMNSTFGQMNKENDNVSTQQKINSKMSSSSSLSSTLKRSTVQLPSSKSNTLLFKSTTTLPSLNNKFSSTLSLSNTMNMSTSMSINMMTKFHVVNIPYDIPVVIAAPTLSSFSAEEISSLTSSYSSSSSLSSSSSSSSMSSLSASSSTSSSSPPFSLSHDCKMGVSLLSLSPCCHYLLVKSDQYPHSIFIFDTRLLMLKSLIQCRNVVNTKSITWREESVEGARGASVWWCCNGMSGIYHWSERGMEIYPIGHSGFGPKKLQWKGKHTVIVMDGKGKICCGQVVEDPLTHENVDGKSIPVEEKENVVVHESASGNRNAIEI